MLPGHPSRKSPRVSGRLAAASAGALVLSTVLVGAQEPGKLGVKVAPVILAEPETETTLGIQVIAAGQAPAQTFLRIRGLPLSSRLSEGHVVSPGVWAVPLAAVESLRLIAPLASSGRAELGFSLVNVDGGVLAETRASLVVAPAWLISGQAPRAEPSRAAPQSTQPRLEAALPPAAAPPPPVVAQQRVETPAAKASPPAAVPNPVVTPSPTTTPAQAPNRPPAPSTPAPTPAVVAAVPPPPARVVPAPAVTAPAVTSPVQAAPPPRIAAPTPAPAAKRPPVLSAEDRGRAQQLLQRGETFLNQGNAAAARQFFRRAADIGLPEAALRLGATYDPLELSALRATGLESDIKEARIWYEKARDWGIAEASARLTRLPQK